MASSKVIRRNTPREINLRLSEGEADFLLGLMMHVGGTANSPRKYANRISKTLRRTCGYSPLETDCYALATGHIEFRDYGQPRVNFIAKMRGYLAIVQQAEKHDEIPVPEWARDGVILDPGSVTEAVEQAAAAGRHRRVRQPRRRVRPPRVTLMLEPVTVPEPPSQS